MTVHDTQNPESREDALAAAVDAVRGGGLIVLPTDTVYGIGADAFTPDAVDALLEAKGRGRDTPPPVLIGDHAVLLALAADIPDYVEDLTDELWPGALTLILTAQRSLTWDLGETRGTVALRMPDDEVALALLRRTGPLAVSSANRHGKPAATTILDAATQLGDSVEIYLDGGQARIGESSTILDTTVTPAEIVREGAITKERIIEVVGDIFTAPEPDPAEDEQSSDAAAGAAEGERSDVQDIESQDTDAQDTDAQDTDAQGADATSADAQSGDAGTAEASTSAEEPGASEEEPSSSSAPAGAAAATSVLDLPSEPGTEGAAGSAEPAAGTSQAPVETPLRGVGEQAGSGAAAPAGTEPATGEDGSESTPG